MNDVDRPLRVLGARRADQDRAVILDIDRALGVFSDLADHLATGADDVADAVRIDGDFRDARRIGGELITSLANGLEQLVEDEHASLASLRHRLAHDLWRNAADLDVHLESADPLGRAG